MRRDVRHAVTFTKMVEASIDSSDEDIFQNYAGKNGIKPYRFEPKRRRLNVDQHGNAVSEKVKAQGGQCDVIIRDTRPKIIFTPNYPDDYDSYRTCNYVIEKADSSVCKVELEVIDFSLESEDKCDNDFFDLGVGYREQNQGLTASKLCGNVISGTKKELFFTNTNTLTTRFKSDGTGNSRGFSIKVKQIRNSCLGTRTQPPPTWPPTHNGTIQLQRGSKEITFKFHSNGFDQREGFRIVIQQLRNSCGGVTNPESRGTCRTELRDLTQAINSPGYPSSYPTDIECQYVIRRFDRGICNVEMEIRSFDLLGTIGCTQEYLKLPDGQRICGRATGKRTLQFPRDRDEMILTFVSGRQSGFRRGFQIQINQKINSCSGVPFPPSTGICDQLITEQYKRIQSPQFSTGSYGNNQRCVYTIKRYDQSTCKVDVEFRVYDIEKSSACLKDSIKLPNGLPICGKDQLVSSKSAPRSPYLPEPTLWCTIKTKFYTFRTTDISVGKQGQH
ncbi:Cubilin [Nymphon striatum]|nr:Cubilin [Nymphon striatum]